MSERTKFILKLLGVIFAGLFLIVFIVNVVNDMISNHHQVNFNQTQIEYYEKLMKN